MISTQHSLFAECGYSQLEIDARVHKSGTRFSRGPINSIGRRKTDLAM